MLRPRGKAVGPAIQARIGPPPFVKTTETLCPVLILIALADAVRVGAGGRALSIVKAIEKFEVSEAFSACKL